ncbi:hypothetical protein R3P38DRAFT_2828509 [Favolaschia claudopus]|uniref:Secreted protein n=1 Tax=Favolaschia claudopus TaxID=2862362 RepID=A0AAW0E772_9AGAR
MRSGEEVRAVPKMVSSFALFFLLFVDNHSQATTTVLGSGCGRYFNLGCEMVAGSGFGIGKLFSLLRCILR